MKQAVSVISGIVAALFCTSTFGALISCPDCQKQVSDHALMCPECGCDGNTIRTSLSNVTNSVCLPFFFHSLVKIECDQGTGVGVCIEETSHLYVVTSQDLLAGAQSMSLTKVLDGSSVAYSAIELANDRNLVRLVVNATNLNPMTIANATTANLALVHVASNNTFTVTGTGEAMEPLPVGTPLLDVNTNVVMILATSDGKQAEEIASVSSWIPVQPLTYRTQSALLKQAGRTTDRAATAKQIRETQWLTPYMEQVAGKLARELEEGK